MIYLINAESGATTGNNGMKTVDMAWDLFLKKNNLNIPYKRYSVKLQDSSVFVTDKVTLDYFGSLNFSTDHLTEDDILVFWGDFLHSEHYLKNDLFRLTKKQKLLSKKGLKSFLKNEKHETLEETSYLNYVHNFYLPCSDNKSWKGTISFGTTLIGDNDFEIFAQDDYQQSFSSFVNNLDRIWTRDAISALQISHLRNDYQQNFLGVDAALLIDEKDYNAVLDKPSIEIPTSDYIVTHFTRAEESINKLMGFAVSIKKAFNMQMYWIPWLTPLNNKKFDELDPALKESIIDTDTAQYSDLIHLLKNSKFVITDTYHLALIAWRIGKPVICVGAGLQYPQSTVHDKKKEVFYMMHNMLPFYFYSELLDDSEKIAEYIKLIKRELEKKDALENIFDKIENQAKSIENDLVNYLKLKMN